MGLNAYFRMSLRISSCQRSFSRLTPAFKPLQAPVYRSIVTVRGPALLIRSPNLLQMTGLWTSLGEMVEKLEDEEESVSPIISGGRQT